MSKISVYEIVTNRIIDELEKGNVVWRKTWNSKFNGLAVSYENSKAYRGINQLILPSGEYATFKKINELGGKVKKGEKAHIVTYYQVIEKEIINSKNVKEIKKSFILRYYQVFEINTQCEGIESKFKEIELKEFNQIDECEKIVNGYLDKPDIFHQGDSACYKPFVDEIHMPIKESFNSSQEYYSTLFHEMIHSTLHEKRLNRKFGKTFGDDEYAFEELVAEIGASYLNNMCRIENKTFDNSIAYLQGWIARLKNDKTMIVKASALSQRATDYILGVSNKDEVPNDEQVTE